VLGTGAILIAIGLGIGILASLGVNRLIVSQLWGVQPHDPVAMTSAVVIVSLIGIAACIVPARRATRVDPVISLRSE
jgi:putative ABC transport system permease protein